MTATKAEIKAAVEKLFEVEVTVFAHLTLRVKQNVLACVSVVVATGRKLTLLLKKAAS